MAVDLPDWTTATNIQAGIVTISGTANVAITNTPSVTISGTPAVTVTSGTINIGNTPSVTVTSGTISIGNTPSVTISGTPSVSISGTPTVILGAGVATVGAVSAINSTVTVAGTISIGNTPSVTISGTPTVNIGNTPSVTISGTPTVNIGTGAADVVGSTVALNGLNVTAQVATSGLNGAGMVLAAGTLIGTIVPELSLDGGSSWLATQFFNPADSSLAASIVFAAANPATGRSILTVAGTSHIRVRVSAYTSGTANCTLRATASQIINVNIGGTPTVILGGGTANVGSIQAISSTVTVAGTINIGNTPAVTISGTPSVTISSGTVAISGTPNINIQSQSITVGTNQPQTSLASGTVAVNTTTTLGPYTFPVGTHAIALLLEDANADSFDITGTQSAVKYAGFTAALTIPAAFYLSPMISPSDTQVTVHMTTHPTGSSVRWFLVAILDVQSVVEPSQYVAGTIPSVPNVVGYVTQIGIRNRTFNVMMAPTTRAIWNDAVTGAVVPLDVSQNEFSITGTVTTNVTSAVNTPTTILNSNALRKQISFWNNATGNCFLYGNVTVTGGVYTNAFAVVAATPASGNFGAALYEMPRRPHIYTDAIKAQSLAGTMNLMATEWT